ncbi:MAG: radical SAM protein [Acidobacteriota bacterium]|nr:radical SAM protein [Acidobacteriota bacterium]
MLFGESPAPGLVGIARLASESPSLEVKRSVEYFEIPARSLLNRTRPGLPFTWTVNPYRGCEFACKYCYARYTHEFMAQEPEAFESRIYAKANIAQILRRELRRTPEREAIAIGTATDPYQPAERRFARTRSLLEVLARERGRTISITTKSDLIVRDLDLLQQIHQNNSVRVNMTVTTLNTKLARILEPRAPRPDLRLGAVRQLAAAGIPVGVFPNPILPLITDSEHSLDRLAKAARDHGATYFGGGILFLMPSAQKIFFPFLAAQFPHLLRRYQERYQGQAYLKGSYPETIKARVHAIRERYGLRSTPAAEPALETQCLQRGLFDEVGK